MTSDEVSTGPYLSAKQHCVELIRGALNSGELGPGARVPVQELAQRYGLSTTPVREAAWQLSSEGLLEVVPRIGIFVRSITVQEALDIYELKAALEPLLARWAAERSTPEERRQFAERFQALAEAAQRGDVGEYVRLVEERRATLMSMARSSALSDEFSVIDGRVRLLRFQNLSQPGTLAASCSQHQRLAEAIGSGDASAAVARMSEHMTDAGARVRNLLASRSAAQLGLAPAPNSPQRSALEAGAHLTMVEAAPESESRGVM